MLQASQRYAPATGMRASARDTEFNLEPMYLRINSVSSFGSYQ